jgi:hypothetical protein
MGDAWAAAGTCALLYFIPPNDDGVKQKPGPVIRGAGHDGKGKKREKMGPLRIRKFNKYRIQDNVFGLRQRSSQYDHTASSHGLR